MGWAVFICVNVRRWDDGEFLDKRSRVKCATHRNVAERIVRDRWQGIPDSESGLPRWAETVAQRQADLAPEILEARAEATKAHQIASETASRQSQERGALHRRLLGTRHASVVAVRVETLRKQAAQDRDYLTQLDALPPHEAVQLIREQEAQAEGRRLAVETAQASVRARVSHYSTDLESQRRSPARNFGSTPVIRARIDPTGWVERRFPWGMSYVHETM